MIKYSLKCVRGHGFEGWFRSSADFDVQAEDKLLSCPACGSADVKKAIMAPAVSTSKAVGRAASEKSLRDMRAAMNEAAGKARAYVEKNFDYVGGKFPEEARRIHYGEKEARAIYGEATGEEAKELVDEGVSIAPLPGSSTEPAKKKLN